MSMLMPRVVGDRLRGLQGRLEAWAARRLSPEEYAAALALDHRVKRNFGRLALIFVMTTFIIAAVVMGIRPATGFFAALVVSALGQLYLAGAVISAWYGYRKWSNRPAWKIFLVLV